MRTSGSAPSTGTSRAGRRWSRRCTAEELADLCASADDLLATHAPERALRAWMDRFAGYVRAKREMADTLRAVFASGAMTVSQAREELTAAVADDP